MVAAAVVGTVVSGAISAHGASQAARASDRATNAQTAASAQQLAFQRQQYADWQAAYGPIQDNLSNFYQNLTSDSLVASGLKNYEQQYQATEQQLQRSFAQRGVDSGAQDALNQQSALATAEYKANLRNDAPLQVARLQQGFLDHNVQNPAGQGVASSLGQQASMFGQRANQLQQQANIGFQNAGNAIQSGVTGFVQQQQFDQRVAQQRQQQFNSTLAPRASDTLA